MRGYTLIALLKTGGQGEVWRAERPDGSEVAVKVIKVAKGFDDADAEREHKRFVREIKTQSVLSHPGIVEVLESGEEDERPWYSMPLASGSLRDLLVMNPGGMEESEVVRIFSAVLDAVVYSHREGAIHRDLKPENVLMFQDVPRLSDYGLVRRLHSGSSTITIADGLGSTKYAAPEQLEEGHDVGERADVYSLGCILFEMLTGRAFFPQRNLQLAPQKFRGIIHKSTELDAAARYSSSVEMSRALKMAAEDMERLQSPSTRAEALILPIASGTFEATDVSALAQILIQYSDDAHLYHYTLPGAGVGVVTALAQREPTSFKQIVRAFDTLTRDVTNFDWDHIDILGRFMCSAIRATENVDDRILLFRCLLEVAARYNRFRVRTMWIKAAHDVLQDPTFAPIIADILHQCPEGRVFLRDEMSPTSVPPIVAEALAA
jgi:hypothetical protein